MIRDLTRASAVDLVDVTMQDYGDSALLVTVHLGTEDDNWRVAHHVEAEFARMSPRGVFGTIATYDAVLVEFDCAVTDHGTVQTVVEAALGSYGTAEGMVSRTFLLPVAYGGDYGPDLAELAKEGKVET